MKTILKAVALSSLAVCLGSCETNITVPTEHAVGCEHILLDTVLQGIGSENPSIPSRRQQYRNDKQLVPGQKVSDFTLLNMEGEEVTLSNVLAENDTVLVDFWASWCGPCVASFPKLKELRVAYKQKGFEIVSISIDRTREDWVESSDKHELPWINLGELESWHGEVAKAYGVRFVPKSYLIDNEGCIVQKDLPTTLLEEVIISHFSETAVEDSSADTDT